MTGLASKIAGWLSVVLQGRVGTSLTEHQLVLSFTAEPFRPLGIQNDGSGPALFVYLSISHFVLQRPDRRSQAVLEAGRRDGKVLA